ncbi:MAG TPA: dienelactone hydrolase family protein, partial [Acidimicrobiales bacterium]|nr:dienelactone hydrolase family protein [Acidimicrobiales bacterium]
GSGPGVIVIAEMPGITPEVIRFARRVVDLGCSVALPHLFGEPGKGVSRDDKRDAVTTLVRSMVPACVSREFVVFATGKTSPVVEWLRALCREEHARCGGPGVGAVGMCFTGGYALAMATEPALLAPVLSQPSLPIGFLPKHKARIDISPEDLEVVKGRCANEDLEVIGMRFESDRFVPSERFRFLEAQLGDAFRCVELKDSDANPEAGIDPHSVLTEHFVDEPESATTKALGDVLDLFRRKLQPA